VGTQVALSVAMLIAAGVFLRASLTAASTDPGFPLSGGLLAEVDARMASQDESRGRATYAALLDRVRALPGVRSASVASLVPFGLTQFDREVDHDGTITSATFNVVGAGYFATLGLPVIAGREFTLAEERDPAIEPVAIVDRILADRLFMGASPIGQSVRVSDLFMGASPIGQSTGSSARDEPGELKRIVGVVAAVRDDVLSPPNAHIYVPFGRHYRGEMTLHARTDAGSEAAMLEPVRAAIHGVDARLPVLSLRTMTNHRDVTPSLWALTFAAKLFAAFGIIAAALATAGVYGLRAYLVSQRTREIGIRVALGATRLRVIGQLVQEGTLIAGAGLVVGALIAVGLVQLLRQSGLLDEMGTIDPLVFTLAPLVLAATTAAASYLPARRALRVDPVVALRPE
jgi:predicted permease